MELELENMDSMNSPDQHFFIDYIVFSLFIIILHFTSIHVNIADTLLLLLNIRNSLK